MGVCKPSRIIDMWLVLVTYPQGRWIHLDSRWADSRSRNRHLHWSGLSLSLSKAVDSSMKANRGFTGGKRHLQPDFDVSFVFGSFQDSFLPPVTYLAPGGWNRFGQHTQTGWHPHWHTETGFRIDGYARQLKKDDGGGCACVLRFDGNN